MIIDAGEKKTETIEYISGQCKTPWY